MLPSPSASCVYTESSRLPKEFGGCLQAGQSAEAPVAQRYTHNAEEVNQVAVNGTGSFLAAADDAGEVAIIDLKTHSRRKRLRGGHSNLCSSVAFRADHPWHCESPIPSYLLSRARTPAHAWFSTFQS